MSAFVKGPGQHSSLRAMPSVVGAMLDGRFVDASESEQLPLINPDDESKLLTLAESDSNLVSEAVASARKSFFKGDWSRAPVKERQEVLSETARLIRRDASQLAALDSLSTGLIYHVSTLRQAHAAADWFEYFAGFIGNLPEDLFSQMQGKRALVTREPVGVTALFTPWNIPLMSASLKLSAALAMGNSCVLKPSEQSPLGAARLVELIHEAGLPKGVLQLVNGRGAVTGAALASHPGVDLISFTGGETAGRLIAEQASQRFAKTTMELGGKSANIVFEDADFEPALDGSLIAAYSNNGQACLAGSRILVHKRIADRFIADFVARARLIRIGRPFESSSELGPLSSQSHMNRVLSYADVANKEGDEILTGGKPASGFTRGYYVEPTVALASGNSSRVCQEEIFGPFATFLIFDTEEQAVHMANDTRYGLVGYVWTKDLSRALAVSSKLRSGYVLVNTPMIREKNAPFGGYAYSGINREGGRWSLEFYSEAKTTVLPYDEGPLSAMDKS